MTVTSVVITTVVVVLTLVSLATQMGPIVTAGGRNRAGRRHESPGARLAAVARIELADVLLQATQAVLAGSIGLVVVSVIGVLLTFYFMRDGSQFWSFATSRLAEWRRAEVDAAGGRALGVLGGYMMAPVRFSSGRPPSSSS